MKNQLRKATLRAAALTMSATIAATSVPMTAFAQDTNEGSDDNQKKQESQNQTSEKDVKTAETVAAEKINDANTAVADIKPSDSVKDIETDIADKETGNNLTVGEVVQDAKDATEAAVKAEGKVGIEKTVANDVATLVNSDITKVGLYEDVNALQEIANAADGIVTGDEKAQNDANDKLADYQKDIDAAKNKQEADGLYKDASDIASKASEAHEKAKTDLEDKIGEYTKAKEDLKKKLSDYEGMVNAGITDLKTVEEDLQIAKDNVEKLEKEVTELETKVAAAKDDLDKSIEAYNKNEAVKLTEAYNKDADANKVEFFKKFVEDKYIKSLDKDATFVGIGEYDKENNLYPVTYKVGEKEEIIYVSYEYTEDGIKITKKDKNTDKEAVEEHYACSNGKELTVDQHDDLERDGQILKSEEGKEYLISSVAYKDALIKEGENNVTEINEETFEYKIGEGGIVQVYGEVTTVTKTTTPLEVKTEVFDTKEAAEKAKNDLIKEYKKKGYTIDVDKDIEDTSVEAKTTWSATAVFVEEKSFTKTVEDKRTDYYKTDELIDDKSKIVLDTSYTTNYETYQKWLYSYYSIKKGDWVDVYEERTREVSKTWTVGYADVSSKEVNYSAWNQVEDWWSQLWGGEADKKKAIIEKEANTIKANGGYVLNDDFKAWNWNWSTANLYYVNGRTVKVEGYSSADEATAALNQKLADENIVAKDDEIKKDTTNYVEEAAKYSYKLTFTKTVENKSKTTELIKESKCAAPEVEYVKAEDAVFSYSASTTVSPVTNDFLKDAKDAKDNLDKQETNYTNLKDGVSNLKTQLGTANTALGTAQGKVTTLKQNLSNLQNDVTIINGTIKSLDEQIGKVKVGEYNVSTDGIDKAHDDKVKQFTNNNNNNSNSSSNNNNNNNNQPATPVLPVGPAATTTTTQQVVTLVDDQTPLSATADDTVAPKTNKKVAKKNAAKTTDSDSKKTNKNNAKKQPKKVTPEVEDDTMDEDLEIVSLDDNDQVPLAPGVASNDSTKDIMDETSSVSWLWLIILAVASVVTFGTYKGVKKHNENKGKNNR